MERMKRTLKQRLVMAAFAVMSLCVSAQTESADSIPTLSQDTLRIAFTGDILLDRGVRERIAEVGADALFSPSIDSLFASCQAVVGNLECPATDIRQPVFKRFIFRAEPEWLDVLQRHGITHLNLANNHSIDQGREGLLDTQRNILRAGMMAVGAGHNMEEAAQPVLLADKPRPVWLFASQRLPLENFAFLPAKPCVSQEPLDTLCARIRRLRLQSPRAVIIVSLHWGTEHTPEPSLSQRRQARRLVDAGADALICHHSHTLQSAETYRGCPVFYSIGNFIFDLPAPRNSRAAVVLLTITPDTIETNALPVEIKQCAPSIVRK